MSFLLFLYLSEAKKGLKMEIFKIRQKVYINACHKPIYILFHFFERYMIFLQQKCFKNLFPIADFWSYIVENLSPPKWARNGFVA